MVRTFPNRGVLAVLTVLVVALGSASGRFPTSKMTLVEEPESVPGEVVVKIRGKIGPQVNHARARLLQALEHRLGANAIQEIRPLATDASVQVVKLARRADRDSALVQLQMIPEVQYAEPNYIYRASGKKLDLPSELPSELNDPDFSKTWGIHNVGQPDSANQIGIAGVDVNVLPLWNQGIRGNRKIVVGVIDTGVSWTHPDLIENLYTNSGEIEGDGIDNDGNGFVDDVHGWNFADKSKESADDHGHGSHCAGTIGARGGNGLGVVGVNWEVTILPIKFLSASGSGSLADAIEAINYGRMMKVNILSNSWGGGGFSQALQDAIQATNDAGILFVAAAGNDGRNNDKTPTYPAGYNVPNVVSVAAIDNREQLAKFSNYGATTVHVSAPGVKVYSTAKGEAYAWMSGTSMATPHVAGVAALMLSAHPEWSAEELKTRLIKTSQPVKGLARKVVSNGRVNAWNAVNGIVPPSLEPDPKLWRDVDYTFESEHPYLKSAQLSQLIEHSGAKHIRIHFKKVDTELNYDVITIRDSEGQKVEEISGAENDYWTGAISGNRATLEFKSDDSVQRWGFAIDRIAVIE